MSRARPVRQSEATAQPPRRAAMATAERSPNTSGARRIFVVTPGFEGTLVAELAERTGERAKVPGRAAAAPVFSAQEPGLVNAPDGDSDGDGGAAGDFAIDLVFARQQLPVAHQV